ncbi:hypothetical protein ASNO1_55650 [Corallococcus caeni]|uniref:Uncharacterized protein n=1 Tax=Corallococcus caeni TaxID=3082388 RepID=A0ABQ6QZ29_9BACT|nr:hypothetical protein ASNO1_55650 [Corallococcus sp. NO1]
MRFTPSFFIHADSVTPVSHRGRPDAKPTAIRSQTRRLFKTVRSEELGMGARENSRQHRESTPRVTYRRPGNVRPAAVRP